MAVFTGPSKSLRENDSDSVTKRRDIETTVGEDKNQMNSMSDHSRTSMDNSESPPNTNSLEDFTGDVDTNNDIPTRETLESVANTPLLDKDGKIIQFKSLYSGSNATRRNCQEYIRTLTNSITPDELLGLPTPTFIAIVGHGSPSLIPMYISETGCPFPIYADPTKRLYHALGMLRTLNPGSRPEYQRRGTVKGMWQSVRQGILNLNGGKALQGLDWHQVGGEFFFEPVDISTPITSPVDEANRQLDGVVGGSMEEKRITWCHRMKNTRDHAEIPELREVLGLDGTGPAGKNRKRWTRALHERKGTGLSTRSSTSVTRNEGSGRQSVTDERENAAESLDGDKATAGESKNEKLLGEESM